ncbi:MAG: radical SAM protein, partial [Alphaproteobacteria bacterium]
MSIGSKFRLLRQRWRVYAGMVRAARGGRVVPVVSDLFITTRCNGRCNYCYRDDTIPAADELTTAQWCRVIDELYDLGCRMFNLMGGEPLLREDFPQLLDHIVAKGVLCDVNTNGFLVPKFIESLKHASQIFTSLDGDEAAHDANRGAGS